MRSLTIGCRCVADTSAIDEDRLRRTADTRAPQLRVLRDAPRHVEIRAGVHVRVADAFEMAHDGHARILLHARDETFAASRHDDVDEAAHVAQHDPDGLAILRRHHLHGRFGQAVHAERTSETGMDRGARARAFGAAAQDRGIAALQAKRGRVGRDVRPALVNDADHAERHAHARDLETVRTLPFGDGLPDGIVERRDRFEPGGRRFDPLVVERQPVDHRRRRAARSWPRRRPRRWRRARRRARFAARPRPSRGLCA